MSDAWAEELSYDECLELLHHSDIGRVAVVVNGFPIVLPVNFRMVNTSGPRWVAFRTRPGNVLAEASLPAAFEIDGVDEQHHQGWSVLVQGTLHRVDPDAAEFRERFSSEPWLATERDAWMAIEPFAVTGRRLHAGERDWAFHSRGYL